jgi:ATP-dependent DNA ligase
LLHKTPRRALRDRSGLVLRFVRTFRVREDKTSAEADTIQTLRQLYDKQFQYKGRLE